MEEIRSYLLAFFREMGFRADEAKEMTEDVLGLFVLDAVRRLYIVVDDTQKGEVVERLRQMKKGDDVLAVLRGYVPQELFVRSVEDAITAVLYEYFDRVLKTFTSTQRDKVRAFLLSDTVKQAI